MKVPFCRPYLDKTEKEQLNAVLDSGWLIQGARVSRLEELVAKYVGSSFAVATSSGSTALYLALLACGVSAGDEVIVPSLTWVATAAAVVQCGATPVFCDIDARTFNIDPNLIEERISKKTRAILPVSLFGLSADLPQIMEIATQHNLVVIEDAACSLGAKIADRYCGTFGELGCFSFHPRKSITTGEGGMIVGTNPQLETILRSLRLHGLVVDNESASNKGNPWQMADVDKLGYNYRLSDLHAAVGIAQFDKLDGIIQRRRRIAAIYDSELADLDMLLLPITPTGYHHTYQSYVLQLRDEEKTAASAERLEQARNRLMVRLQEAGVATRPGTQAVHTLTYYRQRYGLKEWDYPNSLRALRHSLAIPLYTGMSEAQIEYVTGSLKAACKQLSVNISRALTTMS